MGAAFHCDALPSFALELPPHGRFVGRDASFFHHFSVLIQHTVMAEPVAQIHTHRDGWLFFPLCEPRVSVTLLHWLVSFLHFECAADSIIARSARPAVSFHLKPSQSHALWQLKRCPDTNLSSQTAVR